MKPLGSLPNEESIAAVDLGSNSFHLLVARPDGGGIHVLDRHKERVQLAAGLTKNKQLDAAARERALGCLARFSQLIRHLPSDRVVAVGTSTIRQLKDDGAFAAEASKILGHDIEVISGPEEARLIFTGVLHTEPRSDHNRLIVDIGGGSTECVIASGPKLLTADSLHMGCVAYNKQFFGSGKLSKKRFARAEAAAALLLTSMREKYVSLGHHEAYGSSGTILAVSSMLRAARLTDGEITPAGVARLREILTLAGHIDRLNLPGLEPDRNNSIAGGLAVLSAVFKALEIQVMRTTSAALREGVVFELLGRDVEGDLREQTVRKMMDRYAVDQAQAVRVKQTALRLAEQASAWKLDPRHRKLLAWAADLHEIGLAISHGRYHKHGEYLLQNSVMPGFTQDAQRMVAALVRAHRRKLDPSIFARLSPADRKSAPRLAALLRIARKLNRARGSEQTPDTTLRVTKRKLMLGLPKGLLEANPVTALDLDLEAAELTQLGLALVLETA